MLATLLVSVFAQGPPVAAPDMLTRAEWGARPPVIALVPHRVKKITVHHAGVARKKEPEFAQRLRNLQAWSQRDDFLAGGRGKPMWSDIPYHYYIDWDGTAAECRDIVFPGDTNTTYDVWGHALVCLEGSLSTDEFTPSQKKSLYDLVTWLAWYYRVPSSEIKGHKDYAPGETDCPGDAAYAELPALREHVKRVLGR
jgi:hypothetical protein